MQHHTSYLSPHRTPASIASHPDRHALLCNRLLAAEYLLLPSPFLTPVEYDQLSFICATAIHVFRNLFQSRATVRSSPFYRSFLRVEITSSHGRADLVVPHSEQVFVLECSVTKNERNVSKVLDQTVEQLQRRGYADKYRDIDEPIHLLAIAFGYCERNLLGIHVETI